METMKRTSLFDHHLQLGAKMAPFAGFDMPIEYSSIIEEHMAVRQRAGIFDVSHMGEIRVTGPDTVAFINYVTTNNCKSLTSHSVLYTVLCNEQGGTLDDLLLYKFSDVEFLIIANASNVDRDFEWLIAHQKGFDVTIVDESPLWGEIALQGPLAEATAVAIFGEHVRDLVFLRFLTIEWKGRPFIVSRTGYTGEDGYEFYGPQELMPDLWEALLAQPNVSPCGLGCRDTLRFEATLPLYGHELSETISPLEAGLGFAVKLDKDFIGCASLSQQKVNGVPRKLVGLELLDRGIARQGYEVQSNGETIGVITTGYALPTQPNVLALALIQSSHALIGEEVDIVIRNKLVKARVRDTKFYAKKYKR